MPDQTLLKLRTGEHDGGQQKRGNVIAGEQRRSRFVPGLERTELDVAAARSRRAGRRSLHRQRHADPVVVGRQISLTQATGNASAPWQTTTYNSIGKPLVVTHPDGSTNTTAYDTLNRAITVTSSSECQVLTTYDALDRLTSALANSMRMAEYTYDTLSQRSGVSEGPTTEAVASSALTYTGTGQIETLGHT